MAAEHKDPGPENFDRWLDTALRARVEAEPRMGLEERVLARLGTEHPRTTFSWMPLLAAAAAVLAVSAALIVSYSSRQKPLITTVPPVAPTPQITEAPRIRRSSSASNAERTGRVPARQIARAKAPGVRRTADEQGLPRLTAFPASVTPTEQERMLAELARGANANDLANFSETLVPLKDVEVSSLQIDPLDSENNGPH